MVNIGNNFRHINTVKVIGSNPVMPAVKIQGVTVTAVTFSIIWAAFTFHLFCKTLFPVILTRTSRNQEIFATKAQRHEGFYFVILSLRGRAPLGRRLSVLVPWWREEKSFATKSTKFTIKKLKRLH